MTTVGGYVLTKHQAADVPHVANDGLGLDQLLDDRPNDDQQVVCADHHIPGENENYECEDDNDDEDSEFDDDDTHGMCQQLVCFASDMIRYHGVLEHFQHMITLMMRKMENCKLILRKRLTDQRLRSSSRMSTVILMTMMMMMTQPGVRGGRKMPA